MGTELTKHTNALTSDQDHNWIALSENTKASYQIDMDKFHDIVKKPLDEVTPLDIIQYVERLRQDGYKNATINRKVASISKMFKINQKLGRIKVNPVEIARESKKLTFKVVRSCVSTFTIEQIKEVIDAENISNSDKDAGIIIKFLAKTGLRISELLTIRLKDIEDLDKNTYRIRVFGKGSKERFITLEKEFVDHVKSMFNHKELLICSQNGNMYNRRYVWRLVKARFLRVIGANAGPHKMRHFFATYKIVVEKRDLKSTSLYLGHSSTAITADTYLHSKLNIEDARIDL